MKNQRFFLKEDFVCLLKGEKSFFFTLFNHVKKIGLIDLFILTKPFEVFFLNIKFLSYFNYLILLRHNNG